MNLFEDDNKKAEYLSSLKIPFSWIEILLPHVDINLLQITIETIRRVKLSGITVYPESEDILRIFRLIEPKDIKVVIIGQDPYHNRNADGIAFSCKMNPSPSLIQIKNAMANDLKAKSYQINGTLAERSKLDYLVEQGVFLLNTILTVEKGKALSHNNIGWQYFTSAVFKALTAKKDLVWMAWGNEAQKALPNAVFSPTLILKATHPVSAAYNNSTWECTHFSKCNDFLQGNGKEPIKWL